VTAECRELRQGQTRLEQDLHRLKRSTPAQIALPAPDSTRPGPEREDARRQRHIHIVIELGDGFMANMIVSLEHHVREVKTALAGHISKPVERLRLRWNGRVLADSYSFDHYQMPNGSRVVLSERDPNGRMEINVRGPDRRFHPCEVDPSEHIQRLRQMLEAKTGISAGDQVWTHHGRPLDRETTLRDFQVGDGEEIQMAIALRG
jgi:hypothetical protein